MKVIFRLIKCVPSQKLVLAIIINGKTELIYGNKLIFKKQMETEIFQYIEIWYNRKRRHNSLNYKTIEEFNNLNDVYKNVA